MSRFAVCTVADLGPAATLSPARVVASRIRPARAGTTVGDLVVLASETARVGTQGYVIDTGDVVGGAIAGDVVSRGKIPAGSTKRILRPGDVVVSRLRPYLRQIGLVDDALPSPLLASTELLVLRAKPGGRDAAFLVAWLLGEGPQTVLAGAVEGGHHPRFRPETLLALAVPADVLAQADSIAAALRRSIALRRDSDAALGAAIGTAMSR